MTTEGFIMISQISSSLMPRSGTTGPVGPTGSFSGASFFTVSGKEQT